MYRPDPDVNPKRRLLHIIEFIEKIEFLVCDKDQSDIKESLSLELSLEKLLQNIGEAVNYLSDEVKNKAPEIPWRRIVNMRNAIVHGYDDIDEGIIWLTIRDKIPELKEAVIKILEELDHETKR